MVSFTRNNKHIFINHPKNIFLGNFWNQFELPQHITFNSLWPLLEKLNKYEIWPMVSTMYTIKKKGDSGMRIYRWFEQNNIANTMCPTYFCFRVVCQWWYQVTSYDTHCHTVLHVCYNLSYWLHRASVHCQRWTKQVVPD